MPQLILRQAITFTHNRFTGKFLRKDKIKKNGKTSEVSVFEAGYWLVGLQVGVPRSRIVAMIENLKVLDEASIEVSVSA